MRLVTCDGPMYRRTYQETEPDTLYRGVFVHPKRKERLKDEVLKFGSKKIVVCQYNRLQPIFFFNFQFYGKEFKTINRTF